MANKKKSNHNRKLATPAGIPPVKKMIDLTKDKNDPKATKFSNAVASSFKKSMTKMHIPVCDMLATNPNLLASYMMNRTRLLGFMDDCGVLVDQCLRDAIANAVLDQLVRPKLNETQYPGKWDDFNLFALARSRVNIVVPVDKPELGGYLTVHEVIPGSTGYTIDQMTEEGNAISFMRMIDYNPNRLFQFAIVVSEAILRVINHTVTGSLPCAFLCNADERLITKYGREVAKITSDVFDEFAKNNWQKTDISYNEKMEQLCNDLYAPIMSYAIALLGMSGISKVFVNNALHPDVTVLKITHIRHDKSDTTEWMNSSVQFCLTNKDTSLKKFGTNEPYIGSVVLTIDIRKLFTCGILEKPKKADLNELGTQILQFIRDMVSHIFNLYLIGALFISDDTPEDSEEIEIVELNNDTADSDSGSEDTQTSDDETTGDTGDTE